jgi:hypothetical protein
MTLLDRLLSSCPDHQPGPGDPRLMVASLLLAAVLTVLKLAPVGGGGLA